jgi:hypothetical protein
MADRNDTAIKKVDPGFLAQYAEAPTGMEAMDEYRVLPRLKLIQGMTAKELKDRFGEGTALVRPGDLVLAKPDEEGPEGSFCFVPLMFFAEFCKWSDLKDNESPNVIERSFDVQSELKAKADDAEQRFEVYEGDENKNEKQQRKYRYVHHLRFPGIIYGDHPLSGTVAVLSFERGEFMNGKNFINAVKMRKQKIDVEGEGARMITVPLWCQVWAFSIGWRPREEGGGWWGFDFAPPDPDKHGCGGLIDSDEAESFQAMFEEYSELHRQDRLRVDDDDAEGGATDEDAVAATSKF